MNSVLEEIVRTGRVATPAGGRVALGSNVSPGAGAFLQRLVERVQRELCLEVGLAQRVSALYLCDAPAFRRRRWLARVGALARRSASLCALLRPEWIATDPEIGIPYDATCLALEKTGDDDRGWDHHREF